VDDRPRQVVIDDYGPLPTPEQCQLLQELWERNPHHVIAYGTAYTERDLIADVMARTNP